MNCTQCWELVWDIKTTMFWWKRCNSCINEYKRDLHLKNREKLLESKDSEAYIKNKYKYYVCTSKQRWKEWWVSCEYLIKLWNKQKWKCAYYWNPISFFAENPQKKKNKDYATLDRIDSTKWYIPWNVAYCSSRYNSMIKKDIPLDFIEEQMPILWANILHIKSWDL